ncbi:hypothetical protein JCM3766R1_006372 [Sporobolomyces carnicolor]
MANSNSHVQDVLLALGLLVVFSLPLAYLFPETSLFQLFASLLRTALWLALTLAVLVLVGGLALVGEKAYKRFTRPDDPNPTATRAAMATAAAADPARIGAVSPQASREELARLKRVTRESRMEEAAEKVVDKLEATGLGTLFRRRRPRVQDPGEAVELRELRGHDGVSSGITRAPPPLPPRQ